MTPSASSRCRNPLHAGERLDPGAQTEPVVHEITDDPDLILLIPAPAYPFSWMRAGARATSDAPQTGLLAFTEAIEQLPLAADLAQLPSLIAKQFCELLGVRRCFLFLREGSHGPMRGAAGHSDSADVDITKLVAGLPADGVTGEILERKRPVEVRDARTDPRPVRSTVRRWNVHSLLGVPLLLEQQVEGIAFLDDLERPRHFSSEEQNLALVYAKLAASMIASARVTDELRASVVSTERRNSILSSAAAAGDRLSALALDGANVQSITAAVSELTARPCFLYDTELLLRAAAHAASDSPCGPELFSATAHTRTVVAEALQRVQSKRAGVIGPFAELGLRARYLVAPVRARDQLCGYLVLDERGGRFGTLDMLITRQAATIVALEMTAEQRAASQEWDASEVLIGELIRGNRDVQSLHRRATQRGVDLDAPHVVVLVAERGPHAEPLPTARHAARVLTAHLDVASPVLATGVTEGIVLLVPLDTTTAVRTAASRIAAAMRTWCSAIEGDGSFSVGISTACRGPSDYVQGYAEARDVALVMDDLSPPDSHIVTAIDTLGAARMLILRADTPSTQRFVADTLGPLASACDTRHQELHETLTAFLRCGRNIRACARDLSVHENTIRYRLSRLQEMLGVDVVNDTEAQLTLQLAVTLQSLVGPHGTRGRPD
jgi:sugar diacid utilization regulator